MRLRLSVEWSRHRNDRRLHAQAASKDAAASAAQRLPEEAAEQLRSPL
jgi:hypothetical protein